MRTVCIQYCSGFGNFTPVDGCAEDTTLEGASVDFITMAQAFHWFNRQKARLEFQRILLPNGKVALIWNSRVAESALVKENTDVCRSFCPGFQGFSGGRDLNPEACRDFFRDGRCEYRVFDNDIEFTLESYIGNSLSASYAPAREDASYMGFTAALTRLFHQYSSDGKLLLPNKTHCYVGEV